MNNRILKVLEVVVLIFVSFSPLLSQPIKALLVTVLIILNFKLVKKIKKGKALTLAIFLFLFLISSIYDLSNINAINEFSILNIFFPMCFFLGFLLSQKYSTNQYVHLLEKIIFTIAIFSLIGVFIYTFFPFLVKMLPNYNYYHTTHKTAYIFNILTNSTTGVVTRNAGIAWEPGAFQFLLNLGLYAYIRNSNNMNFLKIAVYAIAILSTESTAGIFIFIILTSKILLKDKKGRIIIIVAVIAFASQIVEELIYQFEYKLFGSYAFAIRFDPFLEAFNTAKNHLLGLGNSGFDLYYRNVTTPPWDSIGQVFIRYGYPMLFLIIVSLLKLLTHHKLLFAILLVTFFSQNIWFFPLITPFYFMVTDYINVKGKKD